VKKEKRVYFIMWRGGRGVEGILRKVVRGDL